MTKLILNFVRCGVWVMGIVGCVVGKSGVVVVDWIDVNTV